ncbi:MAG TPA: alpha/beta fold hydrolase [Rhodopila sp.]|uniref:alpha/beta fold hydrolase n=1 Tax=Rhodopila sp. TaxID=2480087 RepID=UPI002D0EEA15|nr:alpha/beta fold hydrolase [Rhodopila sp.]HVY15360.1 alpha/beta fold hydrolase [Rhodopila sp.]
MIPADETFDGTWPYAPHFCDAAGFRQHYIDEGAGRPVVMLHGEPTWGYIWRRFVPHVSATHRVIVPDHMGFGKSETPPDRVYTLRTHVENLAALIEALDLDDITLVMQDWGGPIGIGYAVRHPDRIHSVVAMNTVFGYGAAGRRDLPSPIETPWFRWIREGLHTGRTEAVLSHLGSTILSVMQIVGLERLDRVTPTMIRAYAAAFPTPADCKGAIEFPLDVTTGRIRDFVREGTHGAAALRDKPALLVEGMLDRAIPAALAVADFSGIWPRGTIVHVPDAGHYIQEDAPEAVIPALQAFLGLLA